MPEDPPQEQKGVDHDEEHWKKKRSRKFGRSVNAWEEWVRHCKRRLHGRMSVDDLLEDELTFQDWEHYYGGACRLDIVEQIISEIIEFVGVVTKYETVTILDEIIYEITGALIYTKDETVDISDVLKIAIGLTDISTVRELLLLGFGLKEAVSITEQLKFEWQYTPTQPVTITDEKIVGWRYTPTQPVTVTDTFSYWKGGPLIITKYETVSSLEEILFSLVLEPEIVSVIDSLKFNPIMSDVVTATDKLLLGLGVTQEVSIEDYVFNIGLGVLEETLISEKLDIALGIKEACTATDTKEYFLGLPPLYETYDETSTITDFLSFLGLGIKDGVTTLDSLLFSIGLKDTSTVSEFLNFAFGMQESVTTTDSYEYFLGLPPLSETYDETATITDFISVLNFIMREQPTIIENLDFSFGMKESCTATDTKTYKIGLPPIIVTKDETCTTTDRFSNIGLTVKDSVKD